MDGLNCYSAKIAQARIGPVLFQGRRPDDEALEGRRPTKSFSAWAAI
jgi:hypothetical protein